MKFDKTKYQDLQFNDFKWIHWETGIHFFQREESKLYKYNHSTEEQLTIGDIEFMTLNGWTLSQEMRRKTTSKFISDERKIKKERLKSQDARTA